MRLVSIIFQRRREKMRAGIVSVLVIVVLVAMAVTLVILSNQPAHRADLIPGVPPSMGGLVEIGNCTYIPINRDGRKEANIEVVFTAVTNWENDHPEREVVFFDIADQQTAYTTTPYTYGVTIYSRLKSSKSRG
jgi:hypothetical protein